MPRGEDSGKEGKQAYHHCNTCLRLMIVIIGHTSPHTAHIQSGPGVAPPCLLTDALAGLEYSGAGTSSSAVPGGARSSSSSVDSGRPVDLSF